MVRSAAAVQADLDTWYAARTAGGVYQTAEDGTGTKFVRYPLADINATIEKLERELARASGPMQVRGRIDGLG